MRPPVLVSALILLGVDESYQAGHLIIRAVKGRHALVGASVAHDRADLVPIDIGSHQFRAREIGPALSAAGVAAMTKGTILPEKPGACLHQTPADTIWGERGRLVSLRSSLALGAWAPARRKRQARAAIVPSDNTLRRDAAARSHLGQAHRRSPAGGWGCEVVLPSVMPSTHLIASKYILRMSGSLHAS